MAIINVYKDKNNSGIIDVLPSNDELTFFDFDIIGNQEKYKRPFYLLRDNCKRLENDYDYIVIDTPPSLSLMVGNVLCIADSVLIPFQPESYSMRSLTKVLEAVRQFKDTHNNKLEVLGVVATMVDTRTVLHSDIIQNTRKYCLDNDITMFDETINKSVRYASSVAYESLPLTLSDSKNKTAQIYNNLAWEMFNNDK